MIPPFPVGTQYCVFWFCLKRSIVPMVSLTSTKLECQALDGSVELRTPGLHDDAKNYSPNLLTSTLLLIIAISVILGLLFSTIDVVGCFLKTPLNRPVFATFPKELTDGISKYYEVLRAVYGLPDASRLWFNLLCNVYLKLGAIQSRFDPCLFIWRRGTSLLISGITTDDNFIARSNDDGSKQMLLDLYQEIKSSCDCEITIEDPATGCIGFDICYNENGSVSLQMPHHIGKIFDEFFPTWRIDPSCIPLASTPMRPT